MAVQKSIWCICVCTRLYLCNPMYIYREMEGKNYEDAKWCKYKYCVWYYDTVCKRYRYIHMQMCKTPVLWEHFCEVSPVTQGDVRRFELVADTWLVSCGSVARGRLATASYIMSWKNCKNIYLESAPIPRPCAGVWVQLKTQRTTDLIESYSIL